jgi:hypothetical protein
MIIRKETLNEISELKAAIRPIPGAYADAESYVIDSIARTLNLAVADVAAAIKAFKL